MLAEPNVHFEIGIKVKFLYLSWQLVWQLFLQLSNSLRRFYSFLCGLLEEETFIAPIII